MSAGSCVNASSSVIAQQRQIAQALIDAFNHRDRDAWVALFHPNAVLRPTLLAAGDEVYRGHDGVQRYLSGLIDGGSGHRTRLRAIRAYDDERFIAITEVLFGGRAFSPAAAILRTRRGLIVELTAYHGDQQTRDDCRPTSSYPSEATGA